MKKDIFEDRFETEIKPKNKKELVGEQKKLMAMIQEGMEKEDMFLVVSRLSENKEKTQVCATSMFRGSSADMLHLVVGIKDGSTQLINNSLKQMPKGMKDIIDDVVEMGGLTRSREDMPHSLISDDEDLKGYQ